MERLIPPPFNEVPVTVQVSSTSNLALPMAREACLRARFGADFPDQTEDPIKVGVNVDNQDGGAGLGGCAWTRMTGLLMFVQPQSGTVSIAAEFGAQKNPRGAWEALVSMHFEREGDEDAAQRTLYAPLPGFTDQGDEANAQAIRDALTDQMTDWLVERFIEAGKSMRAAKRRHDLLDLQRDHGPDAAYHEVPVVRYRHPLAIRLPLKKDGKGRLAYRRPDLRGRWHETDILGRRLEELLPVDIDLLVADERDGALLHVVGQAAELETLLFNRRAIDSRSRKASDVYASNGFDAGPRYWTAVDDRQREQVRGKVVAVVSTVLVPRNWSRGLRRWLDEYGGAVKTYHAAVFAHNDTHQAWPADTSTLIRLVDLPQRPPTV